MISIPRYDNWRSNADGYERLEYEDPDECAIDQKWLAQRGETTMTTVTAVREDKMRAFDAWVSDAEAEEIILAKKLMAEREATARGQLEELKRSVQAKIDMLDGKPKRVDSDKPVKLKKDGTPYKKRETRSDKGTARIARSSSAESVEPMEREVSP